VEDPVSNMQTPHHYELELTHFDYIVSQQDNSLCPSFPNLSGAEHFMDLT